MPRMQGGTTHGSCPMCQSADPPHSLRAYTCASRAGEAVARHVARCDPETQLCRSTHRLLPPTHPLNTWAHSLFPVAQFLTLCSALHLAEAQHISSPLQGSSPAKT